MNIGEKITKLRKKKGLSQEELGEELNVTRQTISKWELNQTSPDASKLIEIANFFEIGVNELTSDEEIKANEAITNNFNEDKTSTGVIVLIIILILCLLAIVFFVTPLIIGKSIFKKSSSIINNSEKVSNLISQTAQNIQDKQDIQDKYEELKKEASKSKEKTEKEITEIGKEIESESKKYDIMSFNNQFEMYSGTKYGSQIRYLLDNVVTNNKVNKEKIVTVIYKEKSTTDENEIVNIKHGFDKYTEYEVSLDYNQDGYIYKVTITDI